MIWLILITAFINLSLGVVVFSRNPKSGKNVFFGILTFMAAVWIFNNYMTGVSDDPIFWLRGAYAWGGIVISSGLVWILYLCNIKGIIWKSLLIYFFSFVFFISSYFGNLIISQVDKVYLGRFEGTTGPFFIFYSLYFFIISILILSTIFYSLMHAKGVRRSQLLFVFIGAFLNLFVSVMVSFILPIFGNFKFMSLDSTSSLFLMSFIAYSITRYRFLDIKLVILRTLSFGFIIFVVTSIFSMLSVVVGSRFEKVIGINSDILIGLVVAVLITVFYQPLRNLIEKTTNSFLYKKSYNPDTLLAEITSVTSSILDLDHLLASICKTLDEAFHSQNIGVALLREKGKLEVTYQQGFKDGVAEGLVGYPKAVNILHDEIKRLSGLLVIDEMKTQYENGEFEPISPELLNALHGNDVAIILPLHVKEQMIGIIEIGNKKSGDPYNNQDLKTLRIIAGQAAVAIENAKLYDEMKDFNVKLGEEVARKTAQLSKANEELRQLDQAKSEFISIASHQLRTPLTVIKGYISMMRDGNFGVVPPVIMENLEKVYASNERLIHLVENLLDISRIESGRQEFEWKKIRLEDIAQIVVDNLKQSAKTKDLKLFFHKPSKPTPEVVADPNKVHEVMMNFVDNAIKYTPAGEINVNILPDSKKGTVTFCVKDTGRGIDPTVKKNLFKKFSRGKDSFRIHTEGVGLGLYVAKMIIDSHKGKIWAESAGHEKGSQFCFSLSTKTDIKDLQKSLPEKKFGEKVPAGKK